MRTFMFENIHFAIHGIAAFAFLSALWLHWDAWRRSKTMRGVCGVAGWLLLAVSFIVSATRIESVFITDSLLSEWTYGALEPALRAIGYALIAIWAWTIPIQKHPEHDDGGHLPSEDEEVPQSVMVPPEEARESVPARDRPVVSVFTLPVVARTFFPLVPLAIAAAYLRRSTKGLERHVRPVVYVFLGLAVYEMLLLGGMWRASANPTIARLSAPFGFFWIVAETVLVLSSALLIWWVARYLLRRLQTQLFMIFTFVFFGAFLITAFVFSGLLLREMHAAILNRLEADSKVFMLMIEHHRGAVSSDASMLAEQADRELYLRGEDADLVSITHSFMLQKSNDVVLITDREGRVIVRGDDPEKTGLSVADDSFVASALTGTSLSGLVDRRTGLVPVVQVRAAAPYEGGAVLVGSTLDNVFLDGIREATGFDAAVFAGDVLSASSLRNAEGITGVRHPEPRVADEVLARGASVSGEVDMMGVPYLASHVPIEDPEGGVVGMLFIGLPSIELIRTAAGSLQTTFAVVALLMGVCVIPSAFFARRISRQVNLP